MIKGTEAIKGALKRAEGRPSNNLPVEAYQKRQGDVVDFKQWPDWNNGPDFPNWENIGRSPSK